MKPTLKAPATKRLKLRYVELLSTSAFETNLRRYIKGIREFFGTFFQMGEDIWGGFLSWRIQPLGLVRLGWVRPVQILLATSCRSDCRGLLGG